MEELLKKGQVLLDRYLVKSYLNEGGMQQVFVANDQSFNRDVALKVPKNDSAERRFDRSARLSARIIHPNVAKTLDYFEENDKSYLIEELIDGIDLARYLEKCDLLDPHLAAHILHHLARAIVASHHAGVIHRDLKPSNIIVSKDLAATIVKVTDFGIAKMAEEEITTAVAGGEDSITASKTVMGALPYMAPEMIADSKNATKAVDVWALGALTYRLLSGEPPYGTGLKAVTAIMAAEQPPQPKIWRSNRHFEPLLTELWNIIVSCLNKDPQQRPTAVELASECTKLGYIYKPRENGTIETYPVRPKWKCGFIIGNDMSNVFFHRQSFFGVSEPVVGMKVAYSTFPGEPNVRAYPVVPLNQ